MFSSTISPYLGCINAIVDIGVWLIAKFQIDFSQLIKRNFHSLIGLQY